MIKKSDLTKDFYSPGDVAELLGVVPMTVIGYDNRGILNFERTSTNRRIISKESLINYLDSRGIIFIDDDLRYDAIYARVSTQKQNKRGDLESQINTLCSYCAVLSPVNLRVFKDVGSGLNDNRKDLINLLHEVENNKIARIFITYKDRLTRFGFNYLQTICSEHNTEIIQVSKETTEKTAQEELAEDLCAIIHSFSGKLYGLRKSQLKSINDTICNMKEVSENYDTG